MKMSKIAAASLGLMAAALASPARADRCDELAKQLAAQISDLTVGATTGGAIALKHPAVKTASLGCPSRNETASFHATSEARKPNDAFYDFVATASALVFTIPRPDALRGAKRCTGRIGIIRGENIETRYRKLDIVCGASKLTGLRITLSREKDR